MPKKPELTAHGVKRIQMDMPPRSVERLKRLQEITEATSYAEVMRNALRLYEAMIDEVEAGHEIMIRREGVVSPLPVFSA